MKEKGEISNKCRFSSCSYSLLLGLRLGLSGLELLDAAGRVYSLLFFGIERMRGAGYLHGMQRVFLAVGPFGGLFGLYGGRYEEFGAAGVIGEDDGAVTFRMDVFLHENTLAYTIR